MRLRVASTVVSIDRLVKSKSRVAPLRVVQGRIEIEHGAVAQLRGMSLFWSQWMPQFYNAAAVRWLRDDWRVDVVRAAMGVHRGGYLEHPRREAAKVRAVIEAAIDCGI